jgi:hypothetical protein
MGKKLIIRVRLRLSASYAGKSKQLPKNQGSKIAALTTILDPDS